MDQAQHVPVLAGRVTALLAPALAADGAVLVDATLGRAGHARALLEACPGLLLVGIDADVAAIEAAAELLAPFANRVTLVHARYDEIPAILSAGSVTAGPDQVMGLLFDLGVSSPQLDDPGRGFSYAQDAPLDMRMDLTKDLTAADIVNGYPAAELARIRTGRVEARSGHAAVPWRSMLASRNLWLLCLMYFCQSYAWYFYITYLPKFFEKSLNVPLASLRGALYKGGPLWMGAVACLAGGFLSDAVIRRTGSLRWGRRIPGLLSHSLTALCFTACSVLCSVKHDPFWFFLAISAAGFSTDLAMGSAWATCQDIGRRYSAVVAGSMNMIGNLGGALASWVFGLVLDHSLAGHALRLGAKVEVLTQAQKADGLWSGYQVNFMIAAGMYVVGVLCWLRIDATRPVVAN